MTWQQPDAQLTVRTQNALSAAGAISESWHPSANVASFALTSGTIYRSLLGVNIGDVITNVGFHLIVAAAGAAPSGAGTGVFAGIASSAGVMLAVTADVKADAQWTATAGAEIVFPLTGSYRVQSNTGIYVVVLQSGSWAVTQPQLARPGSVSWIPFSGRITRWGTGGTAQTALPAVGAALPTLANSSAPLYVQVS